MLVCDKCNLTFPRRIEIDGKMRNLSKRRFCLSCSPFGSRNCRDLTQYEEGFKTCPKCHKKLSLDLFYTRRRGEPDSYCIQCSNRYGRGKLRSVKQQCVDYKGGKCELCGYSRCLAALDFHHTDPAKKKFSISQLRHCEFSFLKDEVDKCILLCANCHREMHYED